MRYIRSGACVTCAKICAREHYRKAQGLDRDAPVADGRLKLVRARADVVFDAYWRDGENESALRRWFGIGVHNFHQIVHERDAGRPRRNRRRRAASE